MSTVNVFAAWNSGECSWCKRAHEPGDLVYGLCFERGGHKVLLLCSACIAPELERLSIQAKMAEPARSKAVQAFREPARWKAWRDEMRARAQSRLGSAVPS